MEYLVKPGWKLNPNKKVRERIIHLCEINDGECPCSNPGKTREDRLCPCVEYREHDHCCCTLYVKQNDL